MSEDLQKTKGVVEQVVAGLHNRNQAVQLDLTETKSIVEEVFREMIQREEMSKRDLHKTKEVMEEEVIRLRREMEAMGSQQNLN